MLHRALLSLCLAPVFALAQGATAPSCALETSTQPATIVELYTSEGCSSCPPADRWASRLKQRGGEVLVLGFHVNYWDSLGWRDRFATEQATERQRLLQRAMGTRYIYTPQVVANGSDLRTWSKSPLEPLPSHPLQIVLQRDGATIRAKIDAPTSQRLAGYWAVIEDGHSSRVRSGENAGETLTHDHVVMHYQPVSAWQAPSVRAFTLDARAVAAAPTSPSRRVAFVVTDAEGARPLKAAVLGC